jgi:AraC family transcriptional regulator
MRDQPRAATTLEHGRWFGTTLGTRTVAQYTIAELQSVLADEALPEHVHTDAHFVLPLAGSYVSSARGWASAEIRRMAIYNPPGIVHRDRFTTQTGAFFAVSIGCEALSLLDPHVLPGDALATTDGEILQLLRDLYRERRRWDAHSPLIAEGLCIALLGSLGRRAWAPASKAPPWLQHVLAHIEEVETAHRTIAGLAAVAGVSAHDFVRTFRHHVGTSPGVFVQRRRMAAARARLATDASIVDVALSLGYADQSAFTKAFTRANGISPARFRATR